MGTSIVIFSMLCVFLARDVQLLSAYRSDSMLKRLTVYATSILVFTGLLTILARFPHPAGFQTLVRIPAVWMGSLILHLCVLGAALWVKRRGEFRRAWWLATVPAPVLLLCLLSVPFATGTHRWIHPQVAAASVATIWVFLIGVALFLLERFRFESESTAALDYAAMSNCTVLALLLSCVFTAGVNVTVL